MANTSLYLAFERTRDYVIAKCDDILSQAKTFTTSTVETVSNLLYAHAGNTDNPHKVTKSQVGLSNVDNTADTNKPVSTAQKAAIDQVQNSLNSAVDGLEESISGVESKLNNYLPLTAGESYPLTGPLGLTETTNYGASLPNSGFEGQVFFLEEDSDDLLSKLVFNTTLAYNSWSSSAPYTQTIYLSGVVSSDLPHVAVNYDSTLSTAIDQRDNFSNVSDVIAGDGYVTFKCFESKPQINIPIVIEIIH